MTTPAPARHLARLNVARFRPPVDDTANADDLAALARVDATAERQPGLVWRLCGVGALASSGTGRVPRRADGPRGRSP